MADETFRFDDGSSYERYMGKWSRLVGEEFIDWLAPRSQWRWLDVGCGNGAFTETIVARCAPKSVHGIDPSEGQLAFARTRPALSAVEFRKADAMALPYSDATFDVAVMPLVLFFVPDPAKGVAEMNRVVCSGGTVSAYSWDMAGGGFPYSVLHEQMRAAGFPPAELPSFDVSRVDVMRRLWDQIGLERIETRAITVQRTFTDFEEYWSTIQGGPSVSAKLKSMAPEQLASLKTRLRERIQLDASGRIAYSAWANAIKGVVR